MIEKTISTKNIYSGKVIKVITQEVEISPNKTTTREIVLHRGAVCAVAVTREEKIVLVKQYRKAVEAFLLEIPAGKLELNEAPDEAVIRELKEETGYEVDDLAYVTKFYTSPGFSNELGHFYIARLGEPGDTCFDESEDIEIFEYTLTEVLEMIAQGEIIDAKTIMGILLYCQKNMVREA